MIKEEEIKSALLRSGYLLENRVLDVFIKSKYWAESSHRYFVEDGKYREIDVLATKQIESIVFEVKKETLTLYPHFLIECINNPIPLALFENVGDTERKSRDWAYRFTNGSSLLIEQASIKWHYALNMYESEIFEKLPSRQYCGFTLKKGTKDEWMANHPDDFHQTLLKLVDFTKYKNREIADRWKGVQPTSGRLDIFIPLIVLQNEMIEIKTQPELEISPIQYYRLKVPYKSIYRKSISIDVVTESYLKNYLEKKQNVLKRMFDKLKNDLEGYDQLPGQEL